MRGMQATLAQARDLTSAEQNAAVLTMATELLADDSIDVFAEADRCRDPEFVQATNPLQLEALMCAQSRARLQACEGPMHLSVVWAMYQETARILPKSECEHGEDLVRAKVAQMRWLFDGLDAGKTWELIACDDGCPESPSSSEVMQSIIDVEGYGGCAKVIRLADGIAAGHPVGEGFAKLQSAKDSRKGGSIAYAMWTAMQQQTDSRHIVLFTDADLSSNLAQAGSLVSAITRDGYASAIGQRYGLRGSMLVKEEGAITEPRSTGAKPSRNILLLRHFARVTALPQLAHVLDTQAGFKAFDADVLRTVVPQLTAFHETFDVELMLRTAQTQPQRALALVPILFTEDFALTNFPSVDPGQQHLDMIQQIIAIYDGCVHATAPATGEAAALIELFRGLNADRYCTLISNLEAQDDTGIDDPNLFERRWSLSELLRLSTAN